MYACVSRARTSRKLRTSPVTLPPREARKFFAFSNTEIVDPPFPNPRLRRGAPTRPPQNRRDPAKMTHAFFALTDRLLVSFIGPFACSRAITGRKCGYSFDTEHTVACASRQRLREVSPPFLLFSSFLPFFFPSLLPRLRRGSFIFYFLQH